MNLASFLANKCFEFLLHCEAEKGREHGFPSGRKHGQSPAAPPPPIRPPWSLAEQEFRLKCNGCGACRELCGDKILVLDKEGRPVVDFARGACSFCGTCAESCLRHAFLPDRTQQPWDIRAVVSDACLARQKVFCRTCAENCPEAAIIFPRQAGAVTVPLIRAEQCSGCGACVNPCPAGAIALRTGEE